MKDRDRQEQTYLRSPVLRLSRTFTTNVYKRYFLFSTKKRVYKHFYLFSTFTTSMDKATVGSGFNVGRCSMHMSKKREKTCSLNTSLRGN